MSALRDALYKELENPGTVTKSRLRSILSETFAEEQREIAQKQSVAWQEGARSRWPDRENPYEQAAK